MNWGMENVLGMNALRDRERFRDECINVLGVNTLGDGESIGDECIRRWRTSSGMNAMHAYLLAGLLPRYRLYDGICAYNEPRGEWASESQGMMEGVSNCACERASSISCAAS